MTSIPTSLTVRLTPIPNSPFLSSISKGVFSVLSPLGSCKDGGLLSTTRPLLMSGLNEAAEEDGTFKGSVG